MRKRLLFSKKENRDRAWRQQGGRRSSTRNQQIHPMYVQDVGSDDTGIGNTVYKTFFAVLYILELE